MLDIRKRTGWLFFIAMMAQVILVSAQVQSKSGARVLQAVTFETFSHVERGSAGVVTGVRHLWGNYLGLRGVREQNAALERRVEALQVQLQEEHALAVQAQKLSDLLALKGQATLPTVAAEVIAANSNAVMRSVTIDRGSADGLVADMAVIAPGGLVGRIIGPLAGHAARVQLIVDRNAAAGAVTERSGAGGMVVGSEANPPLRMELVSNIADVKPGDAVVASGVDGIFPKGYLIGHVEVVDRSAGLYRTITVRPGVDFSSLQDVLVVLVPPHAAARDEAAK